MITETNPYQAPEESELTGNVAQRFEKWSNPRLVTLFFLPSLILALALISSRVAHQLILSGVALSFVASIGVSLFSAYVHTVRQSASWGTLALFTFVYLIAQTFALMLCTATLWVVVTRF